MKSSSSSRLPSIVLALAVVAALAGALGVAWGQRAEGAPEQASAGAAQTSAASASATAVTSPATSAAETTGPGVATDRGIKADLLADLDTAPRILIFGGSRAMRFEPGYLRRLTGLTGFNLALQNGRPEDAWAFIDYARRLFPGLRPRLLWFVHAEAFRRQGLSLGLIEDRRLSQAFPKALIEAERATPDPTDPAVRAKELATTTFGPDGAVVKNRYDLRLEQGFTLERGIAWSIARFEERYQAPSPAIDPRAALYFEKTVALANRLGRRPVIVLMPTQPEVLEAIRDIGWQERHDQVVHYLEGVARKHELTVIDLSELSSVPGASATAYYDGIHVQRVNARRILDEVVARSGDALR